MPRTQQTTLRTFILCIPVAIGLLSPAVAAPEKSTTCSPPLAQWETDLRSMEEQLHGLDDAAALQLIIRKKLLSNLAQTPSLRELNAQLAPLFQRYAEAAGNEAALCPRDRTLLQQLRRKGLDVAMAEGEYFLQVNTEWLLQRRRWSRQVTPIITTLAQEPLIILSDGYSCWSLTELAGFAHAWEQLLRNTALPPYCARLARERLEYLLEAMLWSKSAFSTRNGQLDEEWGLFLDAIAENEQNSLLSAPIRHYLRLMENNGRKLSESLQQQQRQYTRQHLDRAYPATRQQNSAQ